MLSFQWTKEGSWEELLKMPLCLNVWVGAFSKMVTVGGVSKSLKWHGIDRHEVAVLLYRYWYNKIKAQSATKV